MHSFVKTCAFCVAKQVAKFIHTDAPKPTLMSVLHWLTLVRFVLIPRIQPVEQTHTHTKTQTTIMT